MMAILTIFIHSSGLKIEKKGGVSMYKHVQIGTLLVLTNNVFYIFFSGRYTSEIFGMFLASSLPWGQL